MKKYKNLMVMAFLGMLLSSCINENEGRIENKNSNKTKDEKNIPGALVAELPSVVVNTDFIVFSVRDNQRQDRKSRSYDSENWYGNYLDNLIFQNIKTQETHVLTKKKIKIISYQHITDTISPNLKTTLYQVIDSFPKSEKHETFTALYLSTNEGKNFTKITKKNEHLHSWKYIPETENIYFTTTKDVDGNRRLNDNDIQSIHSVSIQSFKRNDLLVEILERINH